MHPPTADDTPLGHILLLALSEALLLLALVASLVVLDGLLPARLVPRVAGVAPTATAVTPSPTATVVTPSPTATPTPRPTGSPTPAEPTPTAEAAPAMVRIEATTFLMGDDAIAASAPAHQVRLSAFLIDRYEVSNGAWAACVADGACQPPVKTTDAAGAPYYGEQAFAGYPVIYIRWEQAAVYCAWRGARLPTEAEWELAARWDPEAERGTRYPWGDVWDGRRANHCDASCLLEAFALPAVDDGYPQTAPVESFSAGRSHLGLHHMSGNVAEWTADWFGDGYYAVSPQEDPQGPREGTFRVLRGGAWGIGDPLLLQTTIRTRYEPGAFGAGVGVRCAADTGR